MSKFRSVFLVGVAFIVVSVACIFPSDHNLSQVLAKLGEYTANRPQQKIYVHFDKPLYAAGEDIWFSTYLVDAAFHRLDSISKVVYIELFNTNQDLLKRHALYSPNGVSHGDFHLADTLPAGRYILRAYTNYMKNVDDDFFFVKEITVLNQDTTLVVKATSIENTIDVQFFPEGGNFLAGVENRIAFKASGADGKSIDVEGEILDETNAVITQFKTQHQGMGVLSLIPLTSDKRYHAKIKNSNKVFSLPSVIQKSYLLKVVETRASIKLIVYSDLKKFSNDPCRLYIVAQSGGIANFAAEGEILNSSLAVNIPKSKLPSGITQITVFDSFGIPQCERLVFVNHQNTLKFSIAPDKGGYAKRQKVELDITVTTNDRQPSNGYFSLSVYDESKISSEEKYPSSIISNLLLTSDLKGRIEEPGYYLKDTLTATKTHLDLLMMTNGWRRFTWKTVLEDTLPTLKHYAEQGIVLKGKVLKLITNRPAKNTEVKILTSTGDLLILKTDSLGRFYNDFLTYNDSTNLVIQTDNAKGRKTEMKFQLDPFNVPAPLLHKTTSFTFWKADAFLEQTSIINKIAKGYRDEQKAIMLKEVKVVAKKIAPEDNTRKIYGVADATINMKDIPLGYSNILQALQGRVAGLNVTGMPPTVSIRGGGEPLFLLDGMQVTSDMISSIPINDVESIDVLKGASAAIYGGRGGNGVIAIYTKRGDGTISAQTYGVYNIKYPGFYKAREFYSPKHDLPGADQTIPDIRNTLYWNPSIKTNQNGKARVSFYTSDVTSNYRISVEGISGDGILGSATQTVVIK